MGRFKRELFRNGIEQRQGKGGGKKTIINPELLNRLELLTENGATSNSLRRLSQDKDIKASHETVRKALKQLGLRGYHFRTIHEDDRIEFQVAEMTSNNHDHTFLKKIIFSDEAIFTVAGVQNKHNTIFYARKNPNHVYESKQLHPKKVMAWVGFSYYRKFGPYFFESTVNAPAYIKMLDETLLNADYGHTREQLRDKHLIFQQDGAGPHRAILTG